MSVCYYDMTQSATYASPFLSGKPVPVPDDDPNPNTKERKWFTLSEYEENFFKVADKAAFID